MSTPTPVIRYRRPPLYRKQLEAIFGEQRYAWIEASTKSGKTHGCLAWLVEKALLGPGEGANYWWVAPSYGQAKIAFSRLRRALKWVKHEAHDPKPVLVKIGIGEGVYDVHLTDRRIVLGNGSTIWFKSGEKPDSLYGEDVHACVIDEASRLRVEAFHAIRSTLTATRGPIRIIGNVKGRGNWFYIGCRDAPGKPGHAHYKITAWDAVAAGVLDREEIEDARNALPPEVFGELYECIPTDDGANPFSMSAIDLCIIPVRSNGKPVSWGWDLGRKVDWTVGVALDERGNECGMWRFQKPWPETIKTIRDATGKVAALVDQSGLGDPVVQQIQRPRMGTAFNATAHGHEMKFENYAPNVEGFLFTPKSKQQLIEDLVLAVQGQHIGFTEGVIADEMRNFEYVYTRTGVRYSAPAGSHDDAVMGLALAWRKFTGRRKRAQIR